MTNPNHTHFMKIALGLAARHIGLTAPNPSVACLIVKDNQIIATGITAPGGRPHAETIALEKAGELAKGATAYVTLEPCSHTGKTGPCAEAIIKAKVKTVVIAASDPFHKVAGNGIKQLEEAGIEVITGICEQEALELNAGFISVQIKNRPYVTLKLATSMDGKIATSKGESKWITGKMARDYAHMLRARCDAIMVGAGTVASDNPELTCRLPGLENQSPLRIIVDGSQSIPTDGALVKTANQVPLWLVTTAQSDNLELEQLGVKIITCDRGSDFSINLAQMLEKLAQSGITRLLVEGGSRLATSFIKHNLVDELIWIKAPIILGNEGLPAIADLNISSLSDTKKWLRKYTRTLGEDLVEVYSAQHCHPERSET